MKTTPANGLKGTLIRGADGYAFRVKANNEDGFIDYDLIHNDLDIIINDFDAYFYEYEGHEEDKFLDHSPETLGLKV